MMELRTIPNSDLLTLTGLTMAMYREVDPSITEFGAMATLVHDIGQRDDFTAIGLYKDGVLVGFSCGYGMPKKTFYFSGIYVIIRNNEWTKKLIDYSFALIKEKGYSAWQVDAANGNISSIMEKYGATAKYTRYYKEMA